MYGLEIQHHPTTIGDVVQHRPSVIGDIEITPAGNIALRVGAMNRLRAEGGWHQTEHVVLTLQEANRLCSELAQKVGEAASHA